MKLARRALTQSRKAAQKGFTLIELAIVGLFLGLLAIFAISQFTGSATDQTRANSLVDASAKITDTWSLIAQNCGVTTAINVSSGTGADLSLAKSGTATAATGVNNLKVLMGITAAHADWSTCLSNTGFKPMAGLGVTSGSTVAIQGYDVGIDAATSASKLALTFAVPSTVGNLVVTKLGTAAAYSSPTLTVTRPL